MQPVDEVSVTATDAAIEAIERLRAEHGPLAFFQSGGGCDVRSPRVRTLKGQMHIAFWARSDTTALVPSSSCLPGWNPGRRVRSKAIRSAMMKSLQSSTTWQPRLSASRKTTVSESQLQVHRKRPRSYIATGSGTSPAPPQQPLTYLSPPLAGFRTGSTLQTVLKMSISA